MSMTPTQKVAGTHIETVYFGGRPIGVEKNTSYKTLNLKIIPRINNESDFYLYKVIIEFEKRKTNLKNYFNFIANRMSSHVELIATKDDE
jgi:hypothetical protein